MCGSHENSNYLHLTTVDSTNSEAFRQISIKANLPLWITAEEQRAGRGRNGKPWYSPRGNLYSSHVLLTKTPPAIAAQLAFVAALAVFDTAIDLTGSANAARLKLKWPNDLMCDDAKLAGILLESVTTPEGNLAVIIGMGLNLACSPQETGRAVTNLNLPDGQDVRQNAFNILRKRFAQWRLVWNEGNGFEEIRRAWLTRAYPIGTGLNVQLNKGAVQGTFKGISLNGALEIETQHGKFVTITAGDVTLDSPK